MRQKVGKLQGIAYRVYSSVWHSLYTHSYAVLSCSDMLAKMPNLVLYRTLPMLDAHNECQNAPLGVRSWAYTKTQQEARELLLMTRTNHRRYREIIPPKTRTDSC